MSYIYVKNGASKSAIIDFLSNERNNCNTDIHAFSVIKGGELLCRVALPPYEIHDNKQLYSLSKSFCSTAVGFAVDEGLFKVTDRIVDIFKEDCPEIISDRLSRMTVHNVLTMGTGHKSCVMNKMIYAENPVNAFLSEELTYELGEKFVYNTGATLLLSIIVQKYTGKTVYEYLYEKYFKYLDHAPERWDIIPAGYCEGGAGLYGEIRDIENLGKLYINGGKLGDKQLLSKEWVELATSKQISNDGNGAPDWCAGYGYQFWRNSRDGFRGDGACGQLCFVLPEKDTIISVQCQCHSDMQKEIDGVYLLADTIVGEDDTTIEELDSFVSSFYSPETCVINNFAGFDKTYSLSENAIGIKYVEFSHSDSDVSVKLVTGGNTQYIDAASGEFAYNVLWLKNFKPTLVGLIPQRFEECNFACCVEECTENTLVLFYRFKNAPHSGKISFIIDKENLTIEFVPRTAAMVEGAKTIIGAQI